MSENDEPLCIECKKRIAECDIVKHGGPKAESIMLRRDLKKNKDFHECVNVLNKCNGYVLIENRRIDVWQCQVCQNFNCIPCKAIHDTGNLTRYFSLFLNVIAVFLFFYFFFFWICFGAFFLLKK